MAVTKIKAVHNHLERCLDYTSNPEKTVRHTEDDLDRLIGYTQNRDKTEQQLYVTGINCNAESAAETMRATKQRWNKDDGKYVLAYHIVQSFAPGEVTPEQCFQIGREFANRYLADRYECTVSAHMNCQHLHCHIVFNSVSYVDGKMFRNDFKAYYQGIRKISDEICKANHLSVIEPQGKGLPHNVHADEKQGKPSKRSMLRTDIDYAISNSVSWDTFVISMKKLGYEVNQNPRRKYVTVKHRDGSRWLRFDKLGEGYTVEDIKKRLSTPLRERKADGEDTAAQERPYINPRLLQPHRRRGRVRGKWPVRSKVTGFMALYYHYVYLLRKGRQKKASRSCYYTLRDEFEKFDRYLQQTAFLWDNHIDDMDALHETKARLQKEMHTLTMQRQNLYKLRKRTDMGMNPADRTEQINQLTEQLREYRRQLWLCDCIEEDVARIQEKYQEAQRADLEERRQAQRQHTAQQSRWHR